MESALRASIGLPIARKSRTPADADNPTPVPVLVSAILILVVKHLPPISVVMAAVGIWIIPSIVTISRSRRRNKTGNTDHHSKQQRNKIFHKFLTIKRGDCLVVAK